ncbi:hypothetical protein WN944_005335 [Citrus x changshan-huyou]|uniref:Uncharacterized protein n=1 Tax=Citrus x changshan-huyou TaxID=2935761 RepID=A0AAP0M2A4_9ROSI
MHNANICSLIGSLLRMHNANWGQMEPLSPSPSPHTRAIVQAMVWRIGFQRREALVLGKDQRLDEAARVEREQEEDNHVLQKSSFEVSFHQIKPTGWDDDYVGHDRRYHSLTGMMVGE